MKPLTVNTLTASTKSILASQSKTTTQIKEAFKELARQFSQIPEIGKFKAIKVPVVLDELKTKQAKATISIEPSVLPDDFRTRVLTFTLKSNSEKGIVQEMSPASGNKFSIESTLKNPQIIKVFTDFIKEAGL